MDLAIVEADVTAIARATRLSKVIGVEVYNEDDEFLGVIDDVMVFAGRAAFAILSIGSFPSLGVHLIAIPYAQLKMDDEGSAVLEGATRQDLTRLPEFKYRR